MFHNSGIVNISEMRYICEPYMGTRGPHFPFKLHPCPPVPTHSMNRQRFVLGVGSSLATNTSIHAHPCPPMNLNIAPMPTQNPWAWVLMGVGMGVGAQCGSLAFGHWRTYPTLSWEKLINLYYKVGSKFHTWYKIPLFRETNSKHKIAQPGLQPQVPVLCKLAGCGICGASQAMLCGPTL